MLKYIIIIIFFKSDTPKSIEEYICIFNRS